MGDFDQMERLLSAIEPLMADSPYFRHWHTHTLGYLAYARHQQLEAADHLEAVLRERACLDLDLLGRTLNMLGVISAFREQWDRALWYYQECIDTYDALGNQQVVGMVLANLVVVHYRGLDYTSAINCAERSIAILGHEQYSGHKLTQRRLCAAWSQLGEAYLRQGNLDRAQHALEQSLAVCEKWDHYFCGGIPYHNLGHLYRELGDVSKAKACYLRARQLSLDNGNYRDVAEAVYGLGLLEMQMQTPPDKIQALLDEALAMAQSSNHYEIITQTLLYRAKLQDRLGNPNGALEETRRAVEMTESLRANIVLPADRSRLTASRVQVYEQMVERLCNLNTTAGYAEAFHYAEMSKSRTLIEMLVGRPIRPPEHVPAEWLEQERELRRSLYRLYHDPGAPRAQIATFEAELDQLRERIRLRDTEFESFRTVTPLTLDAVQAQLPEDGVLLEYFTVGQGILVFVVTHQGVDVVRLPLQLNELQRAFKRVGERKFGLLHNMVRNESYRLRSPWILGNLYQKLIEPLEETLHSASVICIVPHGLLHYVPFHALHRQTNSGPRYLIENGAKARRIVYAPSATVLFDYCQNKPFSSKTGCLALGYNNQTLTQAEREAEAVVQLLGGESQTGPAATRSTLIAKGADYRYIHLSCHGWFNADWPMSSSLALADNTLDVTDALRELQFDAELVCLSACEAGRSRILRGDELVGLVRAFLYAGTPSVVVSQWVVDELATHLFMERFYQEIIDCGHRIQAGAKALALSRAQIYLKNLTLDELRPILYGIVNDTEKVEQQLQFLSDSLDLGPIETLVGDECLLAHPYYWASFFIVGDRLSFV